MSEPFTRSYSTYYDLRHREKDYEAESRFVVDLINRHVHRSGTAPLRVLDAARDTGYHIVELRKQGLDVSVTEPPNAATPEPLKSGHCR